MKKPNFLKTRKEKREDRLVRLVATTLRFVDAAKTQELRELEKQNLELELEKQKLENQLLELELEKERRKLAIQN